MIGQTLEHYRILKKLGSGGMGEVYLAEDQTLHRKIALKILPKRMESNPERRARFDREARAIAALNHPNIVTIHSLEHSNDVHFITMEFVEGKTLSRLIPKKGMELNRLLELGLSLADAVGAAHGKEITHRDLKPDNIMVNVDGQLKILDFGLAKLKEEFPSVPVKSEDTTAELSTEEGRILGTVSYMSPEQAEGKRVDSRSDIFSLGIVLYQMATGKRPFRGKSKNSVISSILRDSPPLVTDLNKNLPRHLGRIIKRCLMKNPDRRYRDAKELYNDVLELKEEIDSGEAQVVKVTRLAPKGEKSKRVLYAGIGVVAVLAVAAAIYLFLIPGRWRGTRSDPLKTYLTPITFGAVTEASPSLSPDGKMVVYVTSETGNSDIYLQRVGGRKTVNLTEDSLDKDYQPAYSPDGERIVFRSERGGGGIFVMEAMGESVRRLTHVGYHPAWSPDGNQIVYATLGFYDPRFRQGTSQLWTVDLQTGDKQRVFAGDAVQPHWSPHGYRIAYWAVQEGSGQRDLWTIPARGGEPAPVTEDAATDWNPVWSPDGRFLYFVSDRGGIMNIYRIPIEEETGEVRGPSQLVTAGIGEGGMLSISGDGTRIAYMVFSGTSNLQKVSFNTRKEILEGEPIWITKGSARLVSPAVSPDGELITYTSGGNQEDIFVMRADGTDPRRLTEDLEKDRFANWSPDGARIAFYSDRGGSYDIWTVKPDGSELRQITDTPGQDLTGPVWSPDGKRIAAVLDDRTTLLFQPGIPWREQNPENLPPWSEKGGVFFVYSWSPDGKWLGGITLGRDGEFAGFTLYNLETGRYEMLTEGEPFVEIAGGPYWLGDNDRLVVSTDRKIFLVYRKTKKIREIYSAAPNRIYLTGTSKDGRTIYFISNSFQADIWMVELK